MATRVKPKEERRKRKKVPDGASARLLRNLVVHLGRLRRISNSLGQFVSILRSGTLQTERQQLDLCVKRLSDELLRWKLPSPQSRRLIKLSAEIQQPSSRTSRTRPSTTSAPTRRGSSSLTR